MGQVGCVEKWGGETGANPPKWDKVSPRPRPAPDFKHHRELTGQRLLRNWGKRCVGGGLFDREIVSGGGHKWGWGESRKSGVGGTRPTLLRACHRLWKGMKNRSATFREGTGLVLVEETSQHCTETPPAWSFQCAQALRGAQKNTAPLLPNLELFAAYLWASLPKSPHDHAGCLFRCMCALHGLWLWLHDLSATSPDTGVQGVPNRIDG
jgi:hypothetical protein